MAGAAEKYKAAVMREAQIKQQTNDKAQHSKAEQMTAAALAELTAEQSGAGTQGPSLMDMMFGRKNPPKK